MSPPPPKTDFPDFIPATGPQGPERVTRRQEQAQGEDMMDRRAILQLGGAALAAASLGKTAFAQGTPAAAPAGFFLDAYSPNLQWCRTPETLGKAVRDLGLASVDLSIAPAPGHVDPAKVATELPAFVSGLKAMGIEVRCVTTPITSADSPGTEAILAAAAAAGVGYYTWSGVPYDETQPYGPRMDALKARFAKLAALNRKHHIKGLYQPRPGMAGSLLVDLLPVMQGLDPRDMAFRYDTASLLQARPENMVRQLRMAAPYIGAVALNDAAVNLEFPKWRQGHFTDSPELLTRPNGGGDNTGNAGGDWLAYGGGGRPLPYRYSAMPVGTGMVDFTLLGKTLKDIGFDGPAECQVLYALGGAESGSDKIALPRQEVIGRLKRDRITVEQAFQAPWDLKVARPPFLERQQRSGAAAPVGGPPPGEGPQ
jgi:sugar phosphate isomerase/epimerase